MVMDFLLNVAVYLVLEMAILLTFLAACAYCAKHLIQRYLKRKKWEKL